MIHILPIQPHQTMDAKYVISAVAQRIFVPEKTAQEFYDILEEEGELNDVDNFQQAYIENHGLLLVVLNGDQLIGTGGIKKLEYNIAELKRLWLLEEYHGKKIGYQVVTRLLDFERAIRFYTQFGFYEIPSYRESMDEISMEIKL
jgi:putative acetyltransferase